MVQVRGTVCRGVARDFFVTYESRPVLFAGPLRRSGERAGRAKIRDEVRLPIVEEELGDREAPSSQRSSSSARNARPRPKPSKRTSAKRTWRWSGGARATRSPLIIEGGQRG
jgi:hypothetical protein